MQLITDEKQKELKSHGNFAFPVFVSEEVLSHYERGSFLWHWHPEISWQQKVLEAMRDIHHLFLEQGELYELKIQQKLSFIWLSLLQNKGEEYLKPSGNRRTNRDVERLREILTYLHKHYMEKITLEEIANRIGLCRGECCRFFRRHMKQSLFDYILYYRVEKSLPLLVQSELSVTEIAEQTGFSSSSYYAKVFKKKMNCTPTQYRSMI